MRKFRGLKGFAALAVLALVAGAGCSDSGSGLSGVGCEANLQAKVESLKGSIDAMTKLAADLNLKVATACKNIAVAGGKTVVISPAPTDQEVKDACAAAQEAITAEFSAAGTVTLSVQGGECRVDAQAQVSCEGSCKVDASCTEPDLSVRCTGGELSVKCSGECTGTATCEGSATVKAECQGTCQATCEGTCSGTCVGDCSGTCATQNADGSCNGQCDGTCNGNCTGTCSGTCTGKCELEAGANVTCTAEARCEGECSVAGTEPQCTGTLTPPQCEANADCEANCQGEAKLEAECTPPTVQLVFTGTVDAAFVDALEANLGVLVQLKDVGQSFVTLTTKIAGDVAAVADASVTCAASLAVEIQAAAKASVSVSVSVQASADVSGSASGGA